MPDTVQASQEAATNVDTKHELQKLLTHVRLQSWVKAELGFDSGLDPLSIPSQQEETNSALSMPVGVISLSEL